MKIIPAIDLKDGKCVRLFQGDFEQTTEYSSNPAEIAERFSALAVEDLHIVDLDGARTGAQQHHKIVAEIAGKSGLAVQLGGGIRTRDEPQTVASWFREFGADSIVLALDIKLDQGGTPSLTTQGWTEDSGVTLWECIDAYADVGVTHVLCTDVSRDGAMTGPNFELYVEILNRYPRLKLQASGGVRNIDDLELLRELGLPAAITGRALLDGEITKAEVATFQQSE